MNLLWKQQFVGRWSLIRWSLVFGLLLMVGLSGCLGGGDSKSQDQLKQKVKSAIENEDAQKLIKLSMVARKSGKQDLAKQATKAAKKFTKEVDDLHKKSKFYYDIARVEYALGEKSKSKQTLHLSARSFARVKLGAPEDRISAYFRYGRMYTRVGAKKRAKSYLASVNRELTQTKTPISDPRKIGYYLDLAIAQKRLQDQKGAISSVNQARQLIAKLDAQENPIDFKLKLAKTIYYLKPSDSTEVDQLFKESEALARKISRKSGKAHAYIKIADAMRIAKKDRSKIERLLKSARDLADRLPEGIREGVIDRHSKVSKLLDAQSA